MSTKSSLRFTDEELPVGKQPKKQKPPKKPEAKPKEKKPTGKAAQKKAAAKKPASTPPRSTKLHFEEDKAKPASKLIHPEELAVKSELRHAVSQKNEDENVAVEAVQRGEEASEPVLHLGVQATKKLREHRSKVGQTVEKKSSAKAQQKQSIKHQYAKNAAKAARANTDAAQPVGSIVERAVEKLRGGVDHFRKNPRHTILLLAIFLMLSLLLNIASSCALVFQSLSSSVASTTYPCRDEDMLAAEAEYSAMEADLRRRLDNYELDHDYDRYDFELDEIGHDPYVLISTLTALYEGEWTIDEVRGTLQWLFRLQYTLTETTTTEKKPDPENPEAETDFVSVKVKLKNNKLSHLQYEIMSESQLGMYSMYMATLGNRPDLFPNSEYIGRYGEGSYIRYDIPPEALADEKFAAMIAEAEKYLGYPYVWGGSSPSTSFDCSGFVCWVLNHSGWHVGRTTAQGLCNYCTPVRASDARPGDLVFFVGTYDTPEVSHVGIYVGNSMMIHCGDPITYSNLNSVYWQQHLYCYGRLP